MGLLNYITKMKYLVVFILISLSSATLALTDAGTKIMNQAIMTYFDSESGETIKILSNISYIRVENIYSFDLTPDNNGEKTDKYVAAGSVINIPNIITNTGNIPDSYIIDVNNLIGDSGDITSPNADDIYVYIDANGNGIYDAGERELPKDSNGNYITPKLNPGDEINLVYVVSIPPTDLNESNYKIETTVSSVSDPDKIKTSEVTIIVTTGPVVNLVMSSSALCNNVLESSDDVEYRVNYTSIGLVQPEASDRPYEFTINTASANAPNFVKVSYTGVLITTYVPGNMVLQQDKITNGKPARDYAPVTLSSPEVNFDGGIVLVGINKIFTANSSDHDLEWFDYATWDGSGNVEKVGFLVKPAYLRPNYSGYFSYYAKVNNIAGSPPFKVYSQAEVNLSAADMHTSYSSEICNTLSGEGDTSNTNKLINFQILDDEVIDVDSTITHHEPTHFESTDFYYHTDSANFDIKFDGVHAEIFLPQANQYSSVIDIIGSASSDFPIILRSSEGDSFNWVFAETGSNTGHFRSVIPVQAVSLKENHTRSILDHCLENVTPLLWVTGESDNPSLLSAIDDVINLEGYGLNGTTAKECEIQTLENSELYLEVYTGNSNRLILRDIAYISPQFTVFDSTNFNGVAEATVNFFKSEDGTAPTAKTSIPNVDGLTPIAQAISDSEGKVFYPKLDINDLSKYYITVTPPSTHQWPSSYKDLAAFNIFNVVTESYGPFGHEDIANSGVFTLSPVKSINLFDIPLDPANLDRRLSVQKTADKSSAEVGSYVKYTVIIKNNLPDSEVFNAQVFDSMPYGFKYMSGSTRLNDQPFADPMRIDAYSYRFDIGTLSGSTQAPQNGTYTLTYVLQLTAGSIDSDGINSVYAQAKTFGGDSGSVLVSNTDKYQVRITQTGVMSERGILFGKVFVDAQCNQLRKNQEWPIGGVKIYLETGDYVITDENGQYSMFGVKPGNHVVRVDKQTLPLGIELQPINTRNAGDGNSRFVDMKRGEMHRADFKAPCPTEGQAAIYQELQDRNTNVNGEWLTKTADSFKGLQYDANPSAIKEADLESGIVSGPSTSTRSNTQTGSVSSLTAFKGYALESRQGRKQDLESMIKLYPNNLQTEAYLYQVAVDDYAIRFGFSDRESKLEALQQSLRNNNIETTIVETSYNSIPQQAKYNIDNHINDDVPLPEKEAKNITRAEADKGTWYWPTNDYSYDGRFIVVVRGDIEPSLFVNGERVSSAQLGERIVNKRENAQIVGWYGVGLANGNNLIEIKTIDPFGNERVVLSKNFSQPQSAKHINLMADGDVLRADGGRSVIPIVIRLYDENDNPSRGTYFVTLNTDKGDNWLDPDIQEQETGHQVRVINGEKTVYLRSTDTTGEINVKASVEDFSDEIKLYQVAADRPLFVTGILNYTGRYGKVSGEEPSQQADNYRDNRYTDDERAAIFMKGNIKGGMHLTLSYDSDKSDEEFLREISPDSYYPLPGDASIKGYDARSTSKLFVKLERERHFIMWGDYSSGEGADAADIGRTSQILNGANGVFNNGKLAAQIYGARPEDLHKEVEINGNGTAMFYNIGDTRIVRHSDVVTLLTYDRDNQGLILEQQSLTRYVDYNIDYFNGDMRFNRVIPMYDSELNPIKVRIAYDVDGNGDSYTIAGARLSYLFSPNLAAGASYEHNSHDIEGYNIGSLWVNYDVDSKTKLIASVATMNHEGSQSASTITTDTATPTAEPIKKGSAVKLLLKRDWTPGVATELEYVYAEEGFTNTTGGVTPARQEIRLRHRHKLTGIANLNIEANHSESLVHNEKQQSISATVDTKILGSQWMTRIGSRYIHNETDTQSEEYTTAIVGIGRNFSLFNRPARFDTEYEQSFGHDSKRRFNIKADWNFHKQASIYTQYEYIDSLSGISNLGSGSTSTFTAGIDVDWLNGGSTYSEFRQRGASDGRSLELANGYRGRFEITPGISIDPSVEYVEVLKGDGASGVAVSLGAADIRNPNYKTTGRLEYRHGDNEDYYGLLGAWVTRLSQDWSGLVRDEYRYISKDQGENTWSNHMSMGLAYRPRLNNRYHMLAAYEWKTEHSEISRDAHILSTHQNYQISPQWAVSSRVGLKWEDFTEYQQNYDSVSTIIDGRVIYYINRRWDVDLHAGMLGTDWFNSRRYSAGAGVNYLIMKNLRAGIGYNVIGFDDDDLDPQGYNLQGFYFDLMFKLDEDMFDWLSD